jgi:hypothetical protein
MNMNIDETLDMYLNEIFKKVIRKGKVKRKTICPVAGMKAVDGKCKMMTPAERRERKKAGRLRGKKLKANVGIQKKAMKKRAKSMRKRAMAIPNQGAPSLQQTSGKEGEI